MRNKIYINGAEQISVQKPLCEEWIDNPIVYDVQYARSIDPNFRDFLSPIEARRMGKILKRALATSLTIISKTGIEKPDAIITGTGLGCIENTELFLDALCNEGEQLLKPTYFMQSTHNTISSLLAIHTKSHGYNVTYAHKGISFESALYDAYLQIKLEKINNALVGSHDEMTPSYFRLLEKIGYVGGEMNGLCGEASVSIILSNKKDNSTLCELAALRMLYKPSSKKFKETIDRALNEAELNYSDIDAIMTGVNGLDINDKVYDEYLNATPFKTQLLKYKHIFGECYSASAFSVYATSHCLNRGIIPNYFIYKNEKSISTPKAMLLINHSDAKSFSIIILKSVSDND
ncbi:MAG: beta-ketoacyl synthase chain length factor [Bacteroidales bacterium]|nr:beta-ketoacyl synthase chain length factor [Bacteroidales bacterium]